MMIFSYLYNAYRFHEKELTVHGDINSYSTRINCLLDKCEEQYTSPSIQYYENKLVLTFTLF